MRKALEVEVFYAQLGHVCRPDQDSCCVSFGAILDLCVVSDVICLIDDRFLRGAVARSDMSSFMDDEMCYTSGFVVLATEEYYGTILDNA